MAVVLETTLGDITIDLYINQRPKACLNFLKLCRIKYYNFNLFHTVNQGFIAQTGDPTGSRLGGESIWGVMEGPSKRYFEAENTPRIKHTTTGLVSFVGDKDSMIGSQFFITLAPDLTYLDAQHCVFGEVTEGFEILRQLNESICDTDHRPYQDIRITHTVVLEDPFPDPENLKIPDASPEPTAERLAGGRIAPDEEIDETEGKTVQEVHEIIAEKEAKARATILEMIGDIPDAEMAPPENVLFVCKLNPVTNDDDLEIIFSRFGKIKSCEVIRDKKTGDSLQYAFVEFEVQKSCEEAYFKMDNVLIDDRRIHVDFSQSVAKIKWHGKGRGVTHFNDKGEKQRDDPKNDIGNGRYRKRNNSDSPPTRKQDKREDHFKYRERNEENDSRRNFDYRKPQRDRYKDEYKEEHYRQNYRDIERSKRRNDNNGPRYEENRKNQQRSREYQRSTKQDYRRKEQSPSRSKENFKSRHISPDKRLYRRKYEKSRSRSRDDYRSKYKYTSVEDNNGRRESEGYYKNKKFDHENLEEKRKTKKYEESSDEEVTKKKKKKKRKQESSSEQSSSEDEPVKKSKKKRKKKSKKKDSESDSQSDSEDRKKSKKKKKSKKYKSSSSSESTSESDSDVPKNKKRKR